MISLSITDNNLFMNYLLRDNLFDKFEVREVTLYTSYKIYLDGIRNPDFYKEDEQTNLSKYLNWAEMRPDVFNLIKGTIPPSYFKIVLSTPTDFTHQISKEASTFFLNIIFQDGSTSCVTGTAYSTFTMDKSPEKSWDNKISQFFISNNLV